MVGKKCVSIPESGQKYLRTHKELQSFLLPHQNYKSKNNWWMRQWSWSPKLLFQVSFCQTSFVQVALSHTACCVQQGNNQWPSQCCYEVHPPHPTWNQDLRSFVWGGSCLFLHLSSKLACPEWNRKGVLCRVGDSEMTRILGTNQYILPSFKFVCYHWQIAYVDAVLVVVF